MSHLPSRLDLTSPPTVVEDRNFQHRRKLSIVGACLGLAAFLVFALLPGLVGGGQGGLVLAGGVFGTPAASGAHLDALTVAGMVLGAVAVASLFAVVGAVSGAALAALTRRTASVR